MRQLSVYVKVFIIALLLAHKGYVKYNRLVHFKQQDFTFLQVTIRMSAGFTSFEASSLSSWTEASESLHMTVSS